MWAIKVNKKTEITSACCKLYICNKISIRKHLVGISHIQLFWFHFSVSCKQNINLNEVFHVKQPRLGFSFLPPVSFEIFTESFSSRISSFLPFTDWRNLIILVYKMAKDPLKPCTICFHFGRLYIKELVLRRLWSYILCTIPFQTKPQRTSDTIIHGTE